MLQTFESAEAQRHLKVSRSSPSQQEARSERAALTLLTMGQGKPPFEVPELCLARHVLQFLAEAQITAAMFMAQAYRLTLRWCFEGTEYPSQLDCRQWLRGHVAAEPRQRNRGCSTVAGR